jgi:hypothetical protein
LTRSCLFLLPLNRARTERNKVAAVPPRGGSDFFQHSKHMKNQRKKTQRTPAQIETTEGLATVLDSLIPLTIEELVAPHIRYPVEMEEDAARLAKSFREGQPGIYRYLPYHSQIPDHIGTENGIICAFTRGLCVSLIHRFGWVPVLKTKDILAAEVQAKAILSEPSQRAKAEQLPVLKVAERGRFGPSLQTPSVDQAIRERLLLKVLTVWICFTAAYKAHVPTRPPGNAQTQA